MRPDASNAVLKQVDVDLIDVNPENPRLYFRQGELNTLQESIRQHGIQVPISVFRRGKHFILIDGERRWRCALKLNLKTIPALVQDEPDDLTNVLLMFNIHALREQWDLLTMAMKLPKVIRLLSEEAGRSPTESEISARSGLSRSVIRRCKYLIDLPESYREMLKAELNKPKAQQKTTEDFFIEMERALTTVSRSMPEIIRDKNVARDVLIKKYRDGIIKDLIDLRFLPKIAKAERVNFDTDAAKEALRKVFKQNTYSVAQAFEDTVAEAYSEKTLTSRVWAVFERLEAISPDILDAELEEALVALRKTIADLLRRAK
jgi:ParB family transcriptional regulator, chromosome partitioning protein